MFFMPSLVLSIFTLNFWYRYLGVSLIEIIFHILTLSDIQVSSLILPLALSVWAFAIVEKLFKENWVIMDTFKKTKNIFMTMFELHPEEVYILD